MTRSELHAASWPLIACGVVIACAFAVALACGPIDRNVQSSLPALVVAGFGWWLAVALAKRRSLSLGAIVLGAILLRAIAFAAPPSVSDDVYRYLWEGELVAHGLDPYSNAPDSAALEAWRAPRAELFQLVNHRHVAAVYPPLVQGLFALVARTCGPFTDLLAIERGVLVLRWIAVIADLAVLWLLNRLLRARGARTSLLIAWGWSPLVALEFAGSAHFDSLAILAWLAALLLASGAVARAGWSGTLIGLGAMVKYLPWTTLAFLRGATARRAWIGSALVIASILAVGHVALGMFVLGSGAREYAFRWEAGNLVYRFVEPLLAMRYEFDESATDPRRLARIVVGVMWFARVLDLRRKRVELVDACALALGAFLVLTPTLHPWYLCWMVPFVALSPRASWCWLIAIAPLLYWPLAAARAHGDWREPIWLWPVVAAPFFVLLLREALTRPPQRVDRA